MHIHTHIHMLTQAVETPRVFKTAVAPSPWKASGLWPGGLHYYYYYYYY